MPSGQGTLQHLGTVDDYDGGGANGSGPESSHLGTGGIGSVPVLFVLVVSLMSFFVWSFSILRRLVSLRLSFLVSLIWTCLSFLARELVEVEEHVVYRSLWNPLHFPLSVCSSRLKKSNPINSSSISFYPSILRSPCSFLSRLRHLRPSTHFQPSFDLRLRLSPAV